MSLLLRSKQNAHPLKQILATFERCLQLYVLVYLTHALHVSNS